MLRRKSVQIVEPYASPNAFRHQIVDTRCASRNGTKKLIFTGIIFVRKTLTYIPIRGLPENYVPEGAIIHLVCKRYRRLQSDLVHRLPVIALRAVDDCTSAKDNHV